MEPRFLDDAVAVADLQDFVGLADGQPVPRDIQRPEIVARRDEPPHLPIGVADERTALAIDVLDEQP